LYEYTIDPAALRTGPASLMNGATLAVNVRLVLRNAELAGRIAAALAEGER
jgi:pseudouridine-5'-phosphate glycosidase